VVIGLSVLGTSDAQAQTFGGGLFGQLGAKGYDPTVGVTFDTRGEKLAFRFDTTLRCGHDTYQLSRQRVVPSPPGGQVDATGRSSFKLGKGRVRWSWKLTGDVGPTTVHGTLVIRGKRRGRESCTHKPNRNFQAVLDTAPSGPAATPSGGALYLGLSQNRASRGGLRLPVLVRVSDDGKKLGARWSASARCDNPPPEPLVNFTPLTAVRPDGSFSRKERFRQYFADTQVRYRALFSGHFTNDGAVGVLRLRATVYGRNGKRLLARCDTGEQSWTALGPVGAG
jgi:hypothetical protein